AERWQHRFLPFEAEQPDRAGAVRQRSQSRSLVRPHEAGEGSEPCWAGEQTTERERASGLDLHGARRPLLDLRPGGLDEFAIPHAGRTGGLAGAAVQAEGHLLLEGGIEQIERALGY